jgi:hypothetical protein
MAVLLDVDPEAAGEHARQRFVQFAQRGRLHAVQRRDAQQDVVAQAIGEVLEDLAGMVEFEVHQDGGDDLRMLVADQVGHARRRPSTSGPRCRRCRCRT